jgi:hypothetical protein
MKYVECNGYDFDKETSSSWNFKWIKRVVIICLSPFISYLSAVSFSIASFFWISICLFSWTTSSFFRVFHQIRNFLFIYHHLFFLYLLSTKTFLFFCHHDPLLSQLLSVAKELVRLLLLSGHAILCQKKVPFCLLNRHYSEIHCDRILYGSL